MQTAGMKFAMGGVAIVLMALCVAACDRNANSDAKSRLDHRAPFGVSWASVPEELKPAMIRRRSDCLSRGRELSPYLSQPEIAAVVEDCVHGAQAWSLLERRRLPKDLHDGELSAYASGANGLTQISYSFKHEISPSDSEEASNARMARARLLGAELRSQLGAPIVNGRYVPFLQPGFVPTSTPTDPCDVWVVESIAIELCQHRIVLVDGVEMSLSFYALDRLPWGRDFRDRINAHAAPNDESQPSVHSELVLEPNLFDGTLVNIFGEWLDPSVFSPCDGPDLRPISEQWMIPPETAAEWDDVTGTLEGDTLAFHAIEYAAERDETVTKADQTKITLYMLKQAADDGSAIAMNEIGASQLYCHHGVQQNLPVAITWLERASDAGDSYAKLSIATLLMMGMMDAPDSRNLAYNLLQTCLQTEPGLCEEQFHALDFIHQLESAGP